MAPTPLLTKGNGTLARKWRKIKKRCASFSSGDAGMSAAVARSKSMNEKDISLGKGDNDDDIDEGVCADNSSIENSAKGFQGLRDKWQQWNSELRRRRRNSQGDSVAQWWQWTGSGSSREATPNGRRGVIRSSSLKGALSGQIRADEEDDDEDDVFVTADPIRKQSSQVKSAMIVSNNPYCTGVRVHHSAAVRKHQPTSHPPSSPPSPPASDSSCDIGNASNISSMGHDQDSGYDGYVPAEKSAHSAVANVAAATAESSSSSLNSSPCKESHYGNVAAAAVAAASSRRARPQSVYEKQYGPVQLCLDSPKQEISHAAVINLVSSPPHQPPRPLPRPPRSSDAPPPLPPRPANFSHHQPPVQHTTSSSSTSSLPRSHHRRGKKHMAASDQRRSLIHLEAAPAAPAAHAASTANNKETRLMRRMAEEQDEEEEETNHTRRRQMDSNLKVI